MSVESEILRIQRNVADTYAMVAEKGGTVPLQPNSENLPAAVSSIPAGGSSSGGNPVGTVISFLGLTAPAGYLVCDGTEYEITAYPALADFFRQQFGSANHFGGDGETTFAVPDMRNLFLRGFHGEAGEQLSGEMGERQEGTSIPYISSNLQGSALNFPLGGAESFELETRTTGVNYVGRSGEWNGNNILASYTVRPVNMAVLYCVKAK